MTPRGYCSQVDAREPSSVEKAMNLPNSAELSDIDVLLPFSLDALVAAESQADVLVDQLGIGHDESLLFTLRSLINEGFRNALAVEPQPGRLHVIRLTMSLREKGIFIVIVDPGKGFCINGSYPPYPQSLVGAEWPLFSVVGDILTARITRDNAIELFIKDNTTNGNTRQALLEKTNSRGLGLAAMCRQARRIGMNYDPSQGNRLEVHCPVITIK